MSLIFSHIYKYLRYNLCDPHLSKYEDEGVVQSDIVALCEKPLEPRINMYNDVGMIAVL